MGKAIRNFKGVTDDKEPKETDKLDQNDKS